MRRFTHCPKPVPRPLPRWRPCLLLMAGALLLPLPVAAQPSNSDGSGLRNCRVLGDPTARLACYDALPIGRGAAPAAGTGAAKADPGDRFGLARLAGEPDQVDSRIDGRFTGWGPGTQLRLANGQVWRIDDGSEAFYDLPSPRVVVKRAALGGFRLEIDGAGKAPRVKRVP